MPDSPTAAVSTEPATAEGADRRHFLASSAGVAMAGGLAAGYGSFGYLAGAYLFSDGSADKAWQFVACTADLQIGASLAYRSPAGATVVVARQGDGDAAADFIALSSVCPHLGCQVHWEEHRRRFFCPCHNGVFDPQGNPLEGPPAAAKQSLMRFPLRVEKGLLFIEVPLRSLACSGCGRKESAAEEGSPTDTERRA